MPTLAAIDPTFFPQKPVERKKTLPRIGWTVGKVQARVGMGCSQELAKAIIKHSDNIDKKVEEVRAAFKYFDAFSEIDRKRGSLRGITDIYSNVLSNPKIAEIFVKKTKDIMDIVKETRSANPQLEDSYNVLRIFENSKISEFFLKDTKQAKDCLIQMGKNAEFMAWIAEDLMDKNVSEVFIKRPDAVYELAGRIKGHAFVWALKTCENKHIAKKFMEEPGRMIECLTKINEIGGAEVTNIYQQMITADKAGYAFAKMPEKFVELVGTTFVLPEEEGRGAFATKYSIARNITCAAMLTLENKKIMEFFLNNPARLVDAYGKIAKSVSGEATSAFRAIGSKEMAALFLEYMDDFVRIVEFTKEFHNLDQFKDKEMRELFVQNRRDFVEIARAAESYSYQLFQDLRLGHMLKLLKTRREDFLAFARVRQYDEMGAIFEAFAQDEKLVDLFLEKRDVFMKIFERVGNKFGLVLDALKDQEFLRNFERNTELFTNGRIGIDELIFPFLASDKFAIELGRPIDDLHENGPERMKYLNKLSDLEAIALLLSNPDYFYTSTNHLLFDRFKGYLQKNNTTLTQILEHYGLADSEECRNILFRMINYDRFYGKADSIVTSKELAKLTDALLRPMSARVFNKKYYFLLANGLESINRSAYVSKRVTDEIKTRLSEPAEEKTYRSRALHFLAYRMDKNTQILSQGEKNKIKEIEELEYYRPLKYANDGKLTVVQVFDKEDTKEHWPLTQQWFRKYSKPKDAEGNKIEKTLEGPGQVVYETDKIRVVLFMGNWDKDNQQFIKSQLEKTPNLIITFRGHSYSLERNLPYDIFGNRKSKILFIPGSCGSAGHISSYMERNQKTELLFFTNTSTGMGQVTNAIIDALINARDGERFSDILQKNAAAIEKIGGDAKTISTLKVSTPGEVLLRYVFSQ
ncbi:MAG: hypothetical protein NT157_01985 [Candidatus Micrarchaeota archaeon]|nr:hypothetical protein [Candidatus Micrarchaeota archaeon]